MLEGFKNNVNNNLSFLNESRFLIAISGGLDSVVLAHLCYELNLDFALAHCNFNLRGEESDADEAFTIELAKDMGVEIFIENFNTKVYAKQYKLSTQMAARELRYNWFNELAEQHRFYYTLTAHHADDNLETFLINLMRKTGLDGLTGIPKINNNIVRPLLPFSREDIKRYAEGCKLKWREDSSNESTKYLRNKLRHDVIPKLKEINPKLIQNFNKTQEFLQDSKTIIDDRINDVLENIILEITENKICFDVAKIQSLSNPKAYLYEMLNDYGFTEWNDILDLLDAQSGKQIFSKTHRLLKDREVLILTKIVLEVNESISIKKDSKQIKTPLGTLSLDKVDAILKKQKTVIYLDKDLLKFPLIVRKWEEGDYFYPFGMKGKKKISKYFKDEKLSLSAKESSWLLCSQNAVVWIINQRADNRFKVTEKTKNILKISLQE